MRRSIIEVATSPTAPADPAPAPATDDPPRPHSGRTVSAISSKPGGTFLRLVRFALANLRRRPERFVLSVLGIALAIACVTVVRTISSSFAITGADSVSEVMNGAQLWVVPAAGVHFDARADGLVANGPPPELVVPQGWKATRTYAGTTVVRGYEVSLRGEDTTASRSAVLGSTLAGRIGVHDGDTVTVGGDDLTVVVRGNGSTMTVNSAVARKVFGNNGWWTLTAPPDEQSRTDLGSYLGGQVGIRSTTDPSVTPDGAPLIYDTVGGSGSVTFSQKFSALFSGKVTSSTLGIISYIGLVLGFVIAVSSFLAAVSERRREFGIMSSIGLADEVLYFFLVESAVVFLAAYVLGVAGAGIAVALVIPNIASVTAWAQAAGTVLAFLPAMAIVGALIPVHRLLQQRPVQLLGDR